MGVRQDPAARFRGTTRSGWNDRALWNPAGCGVYPAEQENVADGEIYPERIATFNGCCLRNSPGVANPTGQHGHKHVGRTGSFERPGCSVSSRTGG